MPQARDHARATREARCRLAPWIVEMGSVPTRIPASRSAEVDAAM